jgi:glycosyltransferase involved in cell wall biosynthesis
MPNENKKQIVFIEPKPTVNLYRIARSLKLTEKYETILVCFSEVDRKFFGKAYDKVLILELNHKMDHKFLITFINLLRKISSREGKSFFKKIREMKPYIFQITGPDLFSLMAISNLKKNIPKIYYANDIWGVEKRNSLFKKFGIKGEFQKICERICFKMVDGILNKHSPGQYELLSYDIVIPKMSLSPYPLDEWIFPTKKKKNKEIHIVYGGSPSYLSRKNNISFLKIIKIITSQKIHFHTYGPCSNDKDNLILIQESKDNKYYHLHKKVTPYDLNKEMSEYNFSIFPEFWASSEIESNPGVVKTEMSTRMTNYIEAGLPIIISTQQEYIKNIIEKHGIGFSINLRDLKNIRKILEQKDYNELQKNIKKFQEEFKWSKKIKEIESFYNKVIKLKNEKD